MKASSVTSNLQENIHLAMCQFVVVFPIRLQLQQILLKAHLPVFRSIANLLLYILVIQLTSRDFDTQR